MKTRQIGAAAVAEIGLGCMNLNHAYGTPMSVTAASSLLRHAVDIGITYFDTAALYGFGANEAVLGEALAPYRARVFLASKCGMTGIDGRRVIDGRPETLRRTCEEALTRLRTDVIDLYYLHRWDKRVPIEESVGALAELVTAGHIRMLGLSEVSSATLLKAHKVHPIAAVQNEYSLWSRNPEISILDTCREIGAALIAFSPLGRGFLADSIADIESLDQKDLRRTLPRFQGANLQHNLLLLPAYRALARAAACTPAQLALSWLLWKSPIVIPIPGTTNPAHLENNVYAGRSRVDEQTLVAVDALINSHTVSGARYPTATLLEIDSDE